MPANMHAKLLFKVQFFLGGGLGRWMVGRLMIASVNWSNDFPVDDAKSPNLVISFVVGLNPWFANLTNESVNSNTENGVSDANCLILRLLMPSNVII